MTTAIAPLPRSTPEAEGVSSRAILDFLAACKAARLEMHSLMLLRHGKVLAEGWWHPYSATRNHLLHSLSKSFTATGIGLAVAEGRLTVNDRVIDFFPDEVEYATGGAPNAHMQAMTVRHLLSMNTGHAQEPTGHMMTNARTWAEGFFDVPIETAPGSHFLYNTGATYMLAAILHKLAGETLVDYLTPRLFAPLGIANPVWQMSPQGIHTGGFGLAITTEDIARLGQLYLQKGMWQGKQLLAEAWVDEATRLTSINGFASVKNDWLQGYGYQFWRCQPEGAYRGDGAFGQFCIVLPDQDAVVVITSSVADMQVPLDLVYTHLLPAYAQAPLPADPAAQSELSASLAALKIAPLQGEPTSESAPDVLGVWYNLQPNDFQINRLRITAAGGWTSLEIERPSGVEVTPVGYDCWQAGECRLFAAPPILASTQSMASGAWQTPDIWRAVIRLIETPTFGTVSLAFVGNKVLLSQQLNLNLGPTIFPEVLGTRAA